MNANTLTRLTRVDWSLARSLARLLQVGFKGKVILVSVLSTAATLVDFFTVTLIYPFLQALTGSRSSALENSPLGIFLPFFRDLDVSTQIRLLAVLLLVIHLLKGGLGYITARTAHELKVTLESAFQRLIFARLLGADFSFLDRNKAADHYTIFATYSSHAAGFLFGIVNAIPSICVFLLFLSVVILVSWKLSLLALLLMMLSNIATRKFIKSVQRVTKRTNIAHADLAHHALESLQAMRLIRQFAREPLIFQRFQVISQEYFSASRARAKLDALHQPLPSTISTVSLVIILLAGTYFFSYEGHVWSELILLYMYSMARLAGPVSAINRIRAELAAREHGAGRVVDFLFEASNISIKDGNAPFVKLAKGIEFRDVGFVYDGHAGSVLSHLTANIDKSTTTALVGPSGSGKSTLLSLLMRFYDPQNGAILIDGRDLKDFRLSDWRNRIGVVSQTTYLFNDTIANNIRFGKPSASDDEVVRAAKQANAHDFIMAMSEDYQTLCGDRGVRLSGGQAQRLSIARALLADPQILLLDEATSALDAESELQVQDALAKLSRDRTVIVVAHRLSTVRNAHSILVLNEGHVVEQGTHATLMIEDGYYRKLVGLQLIRDDADSDASAR